MLRKLSALLVVALATAVSLYSQGNLLINGAGATFPYPVYSKWFDEYHKSHGNLQINYQSVGSGAGIKQVTEGTVDFGASDGPMNDEQIKAYQDKHGSPILHFPTVLGAAVPTYNVPGVSQTLNFTPEALAGIFLGRDHQVERSASSPAPTRASICPATDIVVVHRSDGSGTTYIWADYLSKVSEEWKTKVGKGTSVNWPVGLGGKGNEGVAGLVKQTPNSIGYVELIYAAQNNMPFGKVKNSSGKFVKARSRQRHAPPPRAPPKTCPTISASPSPTRPAKTPIQSPASLGCWFPSKISDAGKERCHQGFPQVDALGDGQGIVEALSYAKLPKDSRRQGAESNRSDSIITGQV